MNYTTQFNDEDLTILNYDEIIENNVTLHQKEAAIYDSLHFEIWNRYEQERLWKTLKYVISQVENTSKEALDFGAGTGNITEKLLRMDFNVHAVDISQSMLDILKKKNWKAYQAGRLKICMINIDKQNLGTKFDLVTCYSVIHHMPNYRRTIEKLLAHVRKNGIFYMDHEPLPQIYQTNNNRLPVFYKVINNLNHEFLMRLYKIGKKNTFKVAHSLDYTKTDVQTSLDYEAIYEILLRKGFKIVKLASYYTQLTPYPTPLNRIDKLLKHANVGILIAKKVS